MKVRNAHARLLAADGAAVGKLIDSLASSDDLLWPRRVWPGMHFDRHLAKRAVGGHGPIRYTVVEYRRGFRVVFRFDAPRGFDGTHRFERVDTPEGVVLSHVLEMTARGPARFTWPLLYRPLHDALMEDCLAVAERSLGLPARVVPWSRRVRLLRRLFGGGSSRTQDRLLR